MENFKDIYNKAKESILSLKVINQNDQVVGGGTGFILHGYLITNCHVLSKVLVDKNLGVIITFHDTVVSKGSNGFVQYDKSKKITSEILRKSLMTSSDEDNFDYMIFKTEELQLGQLPSLEMSDKKIIPGEKICFLGYPLSADNLSINAGIISSVFESGPTHIYQIDASVNNGNSGGPLINQEDGRVVGIVTRKHGGFTSQFGRLKEILGLDYKFLQEHGEIMRVGNIGIVDVLGKNVRKMEILVSEIERSANVGIGYAFPIGNLEHDLISLKQ